MDRPHRSPRKLEVERLETRQAPAVAVGVSGGLLTILGGPGPESIGLALSQNNAFLQVADNGVIVRAVPVNQVNEIFIGAGPGATNIQVSPNVTQPTLIVGGSGDDLLVSGGGPSWVVGGTGNNEIVAGPGPATIFSGPNVNVIVNVKPTDTVVSHPGDAIVPAPQPMPADPSVGQSPQLFASIPGATDQQMEQLQVGQVQALLDRASAATQSQDAIIAIVDRNGTPLGVRVEPGVSPNLLNNPAALSFAIDGALAEARTGAFFGNNQAPLTSRTIQFISQTTITQREVESVPGITDPASTIGGPGLVAPIGIHGHFPPEVPNTPQVDLVDIEASNRDTTLNANGVPFIQGTNGRFNVPQQFIPPGQNLAIPNSYGFISGIAPNAQPRGVGTLPGGIPIYFDGNEVGGIGVFFPGTTGFADEENSSLQSNYNPALPDRSLEAEYIAFAALGGAPGIGIPIGTLGGVAPVPNIILPITQDAQSINLVGITLNIVGPGGTQGPKNLVDYAAAHFTQKQAPVGNNLPVDRAGDQILNGQPVPDGWLVTPHAGTGLTADDVVQIIQQGIQQALVTRAAIRLPLGTPTRMVFGVTDLNGNVLGLYRMPDATVFSIDIAVAKARNNAYYNNPNLLQPHDQVPGIPPGTAFSSRTFRILALPFFPEGQQTQPQGPFSILNDGGVNPKTALNLGPPQPIAAYQSVQGYDVFNPHTNFRDPLNPQLQNGVVFFPGGVGLYKTINGQSVLVGGLGVSGDGVDQDDVITRAASSGFTPASVPRVDQLFFQGLHLPYQLYDRNPVG